MVEGYVPLDSTMGSGGFWSPCCVLEQVIIKVVPHTLDLCSPCVRLFYTRLLLFTLNPLCCDRAKESSPVAEQMDCPSWNFNL